MKTCIVCIWHERWNRPKTVRILTNSLIRVICRVLFWRKSIRKLKQVTKPFWELRFCENTDEGRALQRNRSVYDLHGLMWNESAFLSPTTSKNSGTQGLRLKEVITVTSEVPDRCPCLWKCSPIWSLSMTFSECRFRNEISPRTLRTRSWILDPPDNCLVASVLRVKGSFLSWWLSLEAPSSHSGSLSTTRNGFYS